MPPLLITIEGMDHESSQTRGRGWVRWLNTVHSCRDREYNGLKFESGSELEATRHSAVEMKHMLLNEHVTQIWIDLNPRTN